MKIENAKLYEEDIRRKFWKICYDEKYQYYFGNSTRNDFGIGDGEFAFAVLNDKGELIGYISYYVNEKVRLANWFGAINFSDDKFTFAKALRKVIDDCFMKFKMNTLEWLVVCGNPVEKSYDRICKKIGGRIIGVKRNRVIDMHGELHDEKFYEVTREDYVKAVHRK